MKALGMPRSSRAIAQRVLIGAVKFYRLMLSPWLGSSCRFEPTCSAYALAALECHGAATGAALSVRRLLRCHPGCAGGCDPVPLPYFISPASAPSAPPQAVDFLEKNLS